MVVRNRAILENVKSSSELPAEVENRFLQRERKRAYGKARTAGLAFLIFLFSFFSTQAATVTNKLVNVQGSPKQTNVVFTPLSTPLPDGSQDLILSEQQTATSDTNGNYSIVLRAGDYQVKNGGLNRDTLVISVPNDTNTYGFNALIVNAPAYVWPSQPIYEEKINKGVTNGYASLDASGLIPTNQLPTIPASLLTIPPLNYVTNDNGAVSNSLTVSGTIRSTNTAFGTVFSMLSDVYGGVLSDNYGIGMTMRPLEFWFHRPVSFLYGMTNVGLAIFNDGARILGTLTNTGTILTTNLQTAIANDIGNEDSADLLISTGYGLTSSGDVIIRPGLGEDFPGSVRISGGAGTGGSTGGDVVLTPGVGGSGDGIIKLNGEVQINGGITNTNSGPFEIRTFDGINLTSLGHNVWLGGDGLEIDGVLAGNVFSLRTNTLYVANNGSDSTGLRARADKPFLTIGAAKTNAVAGDTIVVLPGTYNERNLLKNGVNLFFENGAIIDYTGTDGSIFDDGATGANAAITNSIMGFGRFFHRSGTSTNSAAIFELEKASVINVTCIEASSLAVSDSVNQSAVVLENSSPVIYITAFEKLYSSNYDALIIEGGTAHIHAPIVNGGGGDGVEQVGGTVYLDCNVLTGYDSAINHDSGTLILNAKVISGAVSGTFYNNFLTNNTGAGYFSGTAFGLRAGAYETAGASFIASNSWPRIELYNSANATTKRRWALESFSDGFALNRRSDDDANALQTILQADDSAGITLPAGLLVNSTATFSSTVRGSGVTNVIQSVHVPGTGLSTTTNNGVVTWFTTGTGNFSTNDADSAATNWVADFAKGAGVLVTLTNDAYFTHATNFPSTTNVYEMTFTFRASGAVRNVYFPTNWFPIGTNDLAVVGTAYKFPVTNAATSLCLLSLYSPGGANQQTNIQAIAVVGRR